MAKSFIHVAGASAAAMMLEMTAILPFAQTPSTQPTPTTPRQPTPTTPRQPTPTTPRQPTPNQPTNPNNPANPANPTNPANPAVPNDPNHPPIDPNNPNNPANPVNPNVPPANPPTLPTRMRAGTAPFAFTSPQLEARFLETNQRLFLAEQRLEQTNAELLKRLGQARMLSGERQNAAVMDLLQQILQNNTAMQQYLVQARTAWAGEFDSATTTQPADQQTTVPETPR